MFCCSIRRLRDSATPGFVGRELIIFWPGDPSWRSSMLPAAFVRSRYTNTLPAPLTDWHWRWPLSVVPTNELGLTVQHVVRFAADGYMFARPVWVLRDGRVTVRRVPWPGTSDRYNISITLRARDQNGMVDDGSGCDGGEGISFSKSLSTRKNAIASPIVLQ